MKKNLNVQTNKNYISEIWPLYELTCDIVGWLDWIVYGVQINAVYKLIQDFCTIQFFIIWRWVWEWNNAMQ